MQSPRPTGGFCVRAENMTYVIVDFEATCCDKGTVPREEMEIIEIGAVALRDQGPEVLGKFCAIIRPVRNPELTQFCTDLTSITQEMVDGGKSFAEALDSLKGWLSDLDRPVFCSWGDYDKHQLERDCMYHGVDYPFTDEHINIKKMFAKNNRLRKPCGLGQALRKVDMQFEGQSHRGIDDATNMARITEYIFGDKRLH